jgi:hypothetical protein
MVNLAQELDIFKEKAQRLMSIFVQTSQLSTVISFESHIVSAFSLQPAA